MRRLYTVLLYLFMPFVLLRLAWSGLRHRGYWERWQERLGFVPYLGDEGMRLWIHAVSVGEVQAARPLVEALRRSFPSVRILLTTTTPTGAQCVQRQLAGQALHAYMPYDLPDVVRRFLQRVRPAALLVMETELWPNLLHRCRRDKIPVILANARVSERSSRTYQRIPGVTADMLKTIDVIAAQSREDADRFTALGADPARIKVTGSLKFDVRSPADIWDRARAIRECLGVDRPIWVAASTHAGEESIVLDAFSSLARLYPTLLLTVAPRHPQRFAGVFELCQRRGFRTITRAQMQICGPETQVLLVDTVGELPLFYAVCDVAFVGGSLVETGGHNPLEAVSLGVPVVTGPHLFNFREIFRMLTETGAARVVRSQDELTRTIAELLADPDLRHTAGRRGLEVVERNRGAVDRLMELLTPYLRSCS